MELNQQQREAVEHGAGPLLVVAGPGTGKTRVITQRILRLLERGTEGTALGPESILALTFTEKAAHEMLRRVADALPSLRTLPSISTFHAFCLHTLREHQAARRLLDKTDVWIFLRQRMSALGLEFYRKLAEPGAFLHDLNEFFSRCQDELIEPRDFEAFVQANEGGFLERFPGASASPRAVAKDDSAAKQLEWEKILKQKELARVFRTSRRLIEEAGASSLGSLVSDTVALWRARADLLAAARSRFRAILIDEFQDTNYGQIELLKLLAGPGCSITAVGDDDQAVYRFRGASHGAFEMFHEAFPGHHAVYLSRNYRSTRKILRAASGLIAQNDRYAEKPPLASESEEGAPVFLLKACDFESEASWIASEIERLARQGTALSGIAVLYRAHHQRELLVEEFRRRKIPFAIRGLSILSAGVIRDLVAYLSLIHSVDESISLTRVLLDPRWRFPAELAQGIRERAAKERRSLWRVIDASASPQIDEVETAGDCHPERSEGSLYFHAGSEYSDSSPSRSCGTPQNDGTQIYSHLLKDTGWPELRRLVTGLRAASKKLPVSALMEKLTDRLGWRFVPGHPSQGALEAFHRFLEQWEEKSETRRLDEFMDYFRYFVEAGGKIEAPQAPESAEAVQMMTVHAAKGLEFPVVFIIGVSSRRFPSTERKPVFEFPQELRKGPAPPSGIHLQEERRLFFVALTRAQRRLYVSSVSKSEKQQSQFIRDLLSDAAVAARDIETVDVSQVSARSPAAAGTKMVTTAPRGGTPVQRTLFGEGEGSAPDDAMGARELNHATAVGSKIRLSATSIEDYRECPQRYRFQHVLKIPTGPQAALTFGSVMHQSVRRYFELRRNAKPAFEEIEKYYLEHWRQIGFEDDYQAEIYRDAGLEQLRGFVERQNELPFDAARAAQEQSFRFELDEIAVEGRIDQINLLDGRGEAELIDYKTGRPRTEKDAEKSLQLSVYALAAQRMGLRPVRLTFYNLSSNEPVSAMRSAEDLEETRREIREAAEGIRQGRFGAKPGFSCRWCDYVPLCPAHEE